MPPKTQYGEPMTIRTPRAPDSFWKRIDDAVTQMNKENDGSTPPVTFNWIVRKWLTEQLQQWEAEHRANGKGKRK